MGKRLSAQTARVLLLSGGAIIVVLVATLVVMASGRDDAAGSGAVPLVAPPLQTTVGGQSPPAPVVVPGCTEPNAQNYDATATRNDGSCRYPPRPPPPPPQVGPPPPPSPCFDDPNCDSIISQLGCTHDLHLSDPSIPLGVVRRRAALVHQPSAFSLLVMVEVCCRRFVLWCADCVCFVMLLVAG